MTDDRTTPMRQPQWPQKSNLDDQETLFADQETVTPPTMPLGDQEGWSDRTERGFVRSVPSERTTPGPVQPPRGPQSRPPYEAPGGSEGATMMIGERPAPVFAWLVVVDGPDKGSIGMVYPLHPDTTNIGRVPGNQIVLGDETCSSQHARIRIEAKGDKERAFVLYDMGSRNGTYVGNKDAYKEEESRKYRHELQDGDYLLLGKTSLVFKRL